MLLEDSERVADPEGQSSRPVDGSGCLFGTVCTDDTAVYSFRG